jgi:hypothetical protein
LQAQNSFKTLQQRKPQSNRVVTSILEKIDINCVTF